jgi:hypothetical protein
MPKGGAERARFVRAHRRSVQRWLDDLQMAGLVADEPERDADGKWWRTQIVLLNSPEPSNSELAMARRRARVELARACTSAPSPDRAGAWWHPVAERRPRSADPRAAGAGAAVG